MTHRNPTLKGQATILQTALAQQGITVSRTAAHELIAKVNGFSSWNVAAKATPPVGAPGSPAGLPPTDSVVSVFEVNLLDFEEYEIPDESPAWKWVEQQASFAHTENGIGTGVWEFMILASKLRHDSSTVPEVLKAIVQECLKTDAKWLLFYQW